MRNSTRFVKVLCAILVCATVFSIAGITAYAKTAEYTYSDGTASQVIDMRYVSARLKHTGAASLTITGKYKYYYKEETDGNDVTPDWVNGGSYTVYSEDTGANGWKVTIPSDGACMYSLSNTFAAKSQFLFTKVINY